MQCATVRKGSECGFMTSRGCNFNGGKCLPVIDKCVGCSRTITIEEGVYCSVAPNPAAKWLRGSCNFATHLEKKATEEQQKINPLKASKRAAASKK